MKKLQTVIDSYTSPVRKTVAKKQISNEQQFDDIVANWPFINLNHTYHKQEPQSQNLQKLIYNNYGILQEDYDPQKQLIRLRRFYCKNRPKDFLSFFTEQGDTNYKTRFNKEIYRKKKPLRKSSEEVTERISVPPVIYQEPLDGFQDVSTSFGNKSRQNTANSFYKTQKMSPYEILNKEKRIFCETYMSNCDTQQDLPPHFSWRWNSKPRLQHFQGRPKSVVVESKMVENLNVKQKRVVQLKKTYLKEISEVVRDSQPIDQHIERMNRARQQSDYIYTIKPKHVNFGTSNSVSQSCQNSPSPHLKLKENPFVAKKPKLKIPNYHNPERMAAVQMMEEIKAKKQNYRTKKPSKSQMLKNLMSENQVQKAEILDQYLESVKFQNQQWMQGKRVAASP